MATNTHIPKKDLIHGFYYSGKSDHTTMARWNNDKKIFYYWRNTYGSKVVETIRCPEDHANAFSAHKIIPPRAVKDQEVIPFRDL